MQRKIRVLVGKPGLDGHDRGAKVVAAALRDAGMEVIYTGLHQTPAQIVEAAAQEDVDVVALSILSGAHMTLFPEVMKLMRARGIGDRLLTGGGIIPPEDMANARRARRRPPVRPRRLDPGHRRVHPRPGSPRRTAGHPPGRATRKAGACRGPAEARTQAEARREARD